MIPKETDAESLHAYRGILNKHSLYATGTTGRLIEEATTLTVNKFRGIVRQSGYSLHLRLKIIAWIWYFKYFRDPNEVSPTNRRRVQTVLHLCDIYSIPLATNLATAELLIRSLDSGDLEWREAYRP